MAKRNETIRIDVEPHIANIDSEVKKYEEKLKKLQKQAQDMGFGDNVVDDIQKCINKLNELKSEYSDDLRKLSNQKIDTDAFDKFSKEVDSRLNEVTENMTNLEETITHLSQTMDKLDGDKIAEQLEKIKRNFQEFRHDTKDAIDVLKQFNELVNIKRNTKSLTDIDRIISRFQKINLDSKKSNIKSDNLKQLKNELAESYESLQDLEMSLQKETNPRSIKSLQTELVDAISKTEQLAKRIAQLTDGKSIFESSTSFTRNGNNYSLSTIADDLEGYLDKSSTLSQSLAKSRSELTEHMEKLGQIAKAEVASFTFEDGGVQVPVVLSKDAMQNCKDALIVLINNLTEFSKKNAVDVSLRLMPLKSDKTNQEEVSKYVKNIQAQITELPEGELKNSITDFISQFEKEYQKALTLKIRVLLSDDLNDVMSKVEELQRTINNMKLDVNPRFIVDDEEKNKLKDTVNEITKDFAFDISDEITKMSDSLINLLSSTDPSKWTTAFAEGLGQVRGKLLAMQELIKPLYKLMNQKSTEGSGAGRPSDETIANRSYVEKFTVAVDSLKNALKAYNKVKSQTKADDFVTDVQKSVEESGRVVEIPVVPVVTGFVEKVQDAVGDVPLNITVGGVTTNKEGNIVTSPTPTTTKSTTKQSTISNQSSTQKAVEEKKEEIKVRQQNVNVIKRELDQINTFNHALDEYVETIRKMKSTNSLKGTDTAENTLGIWSNAYPELREINDYPSALQREELTTKYLNRLGIDRQSHYSPEAQWEQLSYLANKKGKKDYKSLIDKFVQYEEDGGTKAITELTKNKSTQKSLEANYNKFAEKIREKKQKIAEEIINEEDYGDFGTNKPDPKALAEYEKLNAAIEENTQKTKENQQVKTQSDYEAEIQALAEANQKLVENTEVQEENKNTKTQADYEAEILALAKQNQAIEENTQKVEKNTQAKKENGQQQLDTEDYFDSWKQLLEKRGGFNLRKTDDVAKLSNLIDNYNIYKSQGGTRDITDLTDDKATRQKLLDAYEGKSAAVNKYRESLQKAMIAEQEIDGKTAAYIEQIQKETEAHRQNEVTTQKETQAVKENTQAKKENNEVMGKASSVTQANPNDTLTDDQFSELYGVNVGSQQTSEKKTTTKKQGLTLTDKLKSKIAGQQAKGLIDLEGISDREFNLVIDDIVDGINRKVIDLNEGVEHFKLIINNLKNAKNTIEPSFLQTDIVDEENIKQQAKQQGEEAGKAAVEGAKEGTQEAQDSNSPSKVAEALGGDWGTGYANGILKSDAKVRAAVRQLVEDGTLTAQQVIDDLPNIKSDKKYKALVSPVEDYKTDYTNAMRQVKGSITKLSNADNLSPEQLDKYDATFNKWISKLKDLGVDVSQFQTNYDAVRSKFGASLKESLNEVEQQLKKEAEEAEEARKKIWDSFFAEGEKYDQTEETIKTQKTYTELKAAVDEYVKARKRIAQGNPFEHDVENVEKLNDKIIELSEKLNNGKLVDKATSGLTGLEDKIAEIEQQVAQKTQQKLTNTFKGLKGKLESSINDINFEIDKGKHTQKFESELVNIRNELTSIKDINIDAVTQSDIDQAKTLLEQVRLIRKEGKLTENISANKNSIQKNLAQVNSILSGNTKFAFKNTGVYKELVSLQTAFKNFDTSKPQSELAELTTKLLATKAKFEELDNTFKGKNLFQTFIDRLHGTTAQLVAQYLSWMDIIRYTRTMINTIKELDTQLVDLRKTTTMTTTELNEFYYASSDVAKQLGVTTSEIISQAAAWSRLGYSSKEAATEMAQLSSQFTSISPGMTTDNATDYLVSTMQAYGIAVDDVERKIMDNVNRIGNTFATTNAEIGEMLTRSSAAMKAANNSLEETIALETSAVEVTRNAEMTGTAFRTNYCPYVQQCA